MDRGAVTELEPDTETQPQAGRVREGSLATAHELPPAIQWYEGMLLAPQHFQQESLRHEALLRYHGALLSPYHWGVRHLKVDPVQLVDGTFRVLELEAVMPDGLVVSTAAGGAGNLTLDLAAHAEAMKNREHSVHLVVAARRPGMSPVEGEMARYRSEPGEAVVDDNTGQGELRIPRLVPRLRLLLADEPPAKYVSFPLARVVYRNETFTLADYVPPTLRVTLDSHLGELCAAIARRLREKAVFLSDQVRSPSLAVRVPQLLETRSQIASMVAALPPFEAILYSNLSHPYPLYLALCSLAGHVASLGRSLVPPVLPPYDHHELHAIFDAAQGFIFQTLDEGIIEFYTGFPFYQKQGVFYLAFDSEWLGRKLVLGVRSRDGVSDRDTATWVLGAKIASRSKVSQLLGKRIDGAARARTEGDSDLIPSRGVSLYELTADPDFVVPGELLEIRNLDDPDGRLKPVEIILYVRNRP